MNQADLNFLKEVQQRVNKLNTRKSIKFSIKDTWNSSKDRYDYLVVLNTSGNVPEKSVAKALNELAAINNFIESRGYGGV